MKNYVALFEYVKGETGFGVVFPDFPGLTSGGDTYEEALRMAHEALAFHVEGLAEDGEIVPEPRTLEQIQESWEEWSEWKDNYEFIVASIALMPPYGSQKIIISIDSGLVARIDSVAKNRSAFLANAAEHFLDNTHYNRAQVQ